MQELIEKSISEALTVKVFGEIVSNFKTSDVSISSEYGKSLTIVRVHGVQVNGTCTRIENPLTIVLPGEGSDPDSCGFEKDGPIRMWQVKKDLMATRITLDTAPLESFIEEGEAVKGIGISVRLENVRNENGKIKGTVRFEIDAGVGRINTGVDFSIDANVGGWITVWSSDIVPEVMKGAVKVKLSSLDKICARVEGSAKLPDICRDRWGIPYPCFKWKSEHKDFCLKF